MTKHKIGIVTRNTPPLVIVVFSDEVVKIKSREINFLLLYLNRYLFSVVSGNRYLGSILFFDESVNSVTLGKISI